MTDPPTGTPLTRRAARAAAEAARTADIVVPTTAVPEPTPQPAPEPEPITLEAFINAPARGTIGSTGMSRAGMRTHTAAHTTAPAPARTRHVRPSRHANADILGDAVDEVRTAAVRRARRIRGLFTVVAAATLLVGGTIAVTAAALAQTSTPAAAATHSHRPVTSTAPVAAAATPPPAAKSLCDNAAFTAALAAHDTEAAVKAAGGGTEFRDTVVSGGAPCVHLDDPHFTWVVVNKQRPYSPKDYAPSPLVMPAGVRDLGRQPLRADAAAGLSNLVAAAKQAGAGEIAVNSGYRSYQTQIGNYGIQVHTRGTANADLVSARPGFSEHQSGLATDVEPCNGSCGNLDSLAGTPQDQFILDHAWEYGFIVRYEQGHTPVTGYDSEPWHLRFIGVGLAKAYHDGGFHTLEEFFGLPPAPTY
ncbi:M15 family metallopeptidase [Microbacterium sp. ASV49]|uniref:M15 family metallopeptidase n=1 Tax=Microbacterium candidum TaxID=3041922 RepID=A0ABT7MUQ0_9MICO|nr:M15 family metallopeptidase [Microbacterium sp. ASV49]MDL9978169.1 M15 family metallopeptidase [Microbacterium sp. ASV49]